MRINISARHLELTKALYEYIEKKVEKCQRYFDHLVWAQVIITVEKHRQVAEILIHARKITFTAKEESTDLYAAVDLALSKIEKQLKKHKEIIKNTHKTKSIFVPRRTGSRREIHADEVAPEQLLSEVKKFELKVMSIEKAIEEMQNMGEKYYMFTNVKTEQVNVVYQLEPFSFGLIEPK